MNAMTTEVRGDLMVLTWRGTSAGCWVVRLGLNP